ncbi:23S rRNA (guanosine(2251)-2'-O)-methyltransferase RlmB [Candidatus Bandiella euplotis]|uniref:RNA methyltransferase family protein n=1 Tax=Candidatus Bandiella euplotis TaxID=1664265 RepID=A0ABZ0UQH2_9RICK|nr:23S rRNA (guanosine(2251)-2'-O)-methyltransferase RlmB [Candidatus Bandiella woodruffii]WPX97274.1 RNA methyltransferase family protein [Candidatus Bandiella woodruffii]
MTHKLKDSANTYWLYGKHPVEAAMNNPKRQILQIFGTKNTMASIQKYAQIIKERRIEVSILESSSEMSKYIAIEESVHQGIAVKVKKLELVFIEQILKKIDKKSILLVLDQVTDPQNVGAVIRSSLAFGADAVITTKDNAPSENANLVKGSAGAFELIPYVQVTNLARTLNDLKKHGYWIVAITQNGSVPINKLNDFDRVVLLLGAEGKGIRDVNLKQSDVQARINISDRLQSLNVSNAAAIGLYQIYSK